MLGAAKSEALDIGSGNQNLTDIYPDTGDLDEIPDHATETFFQELDIAFQRKHADRLNAIDAALQRMEVGAYGKCAICGKEIAVDRLEIFPETPFCFADAEADEVRE
jgi:RNA polymerase-binding transcription factor DksA